MVGRGPKRTCAAMPPNEGWAEMAVLGTMSAASVASAAVAVGVNMVVVVGARKMVDEEGVRVGRREGRLEKDLVFVG